MAQVDKSGSDGPNTLLTVDGERVLVGQTTNSTYGGKWFVHFLKQGRVLIVKFYNERDVIRAVEQNGWNESKWGNDIWDIQPQAWNVYK